MSAMLERLQSKLSAHGITAMWNPSSALGVPDGLNVLPSGEWDWWIRVYGDGAISFTDDSPLIRRDHRFWTAIRVIDAGLTEWGMSHRPAIAGVEETPS